MLDNIKPSKWIVNEVDLILSKYNIKNVLDLACGEGRHSLLFSKKNINVFSVEKNLEKLKKISKIKYINPICFDLETEDMWPFKIKFDLVLVSNYLYRKNFYKILDLINFNGFLIYETFSHGNELFGKPKSPDFLLEKGELKYLVNSNFKILSFFEGKFVDPRICIKQCCLAKRVVKL